MAQQSSTRSPQAVAKALDISPASLRRWSDEFSEYLSAEAGASKSRSHRRYTDSDVVRLTQIKALMNNGLTYEQVRLDLSDHEVVSIEPDEISGPRLILADRQLSNGVLPDEALLTEASQIDLENEPAISGDSSANPAGLSEPQIVHRLTEDDHDDVPASGGETKAVIAADSESPGVAFLRNTLSSLSDTQKSILNSQAANRELLGVLLQDNFNLKEENNRLRERILDVERQVAQNRQEEDWRLEALRKEFDAKLSATNQLAVEAVTTARSVEAPVIKAVEMKPGCLGALFGRGGTQIITTQPRQRPQKTQPAGQSALSASFGADQSSGPQLSHPKPMFPPE
jgi:DNA-binding transcriptional MerR regulator